MNSGQTRGIQNVTITQKNNLASPKFFTSKNITSSPSGNNSPKKLDGFKDYLQEENNTQLKQSSPPKKAADSSSLKI